MNYVESKMFNASGKMAKLLGTDAFLDGTGVVSSAISLDGLLQALDNDTTYHSYGGITRTDLGVAATTNNAGINGYRAALNPFSITGMQTAFGSCWFGNEHIDLIVTTQAIWDMIWGKLQPQQRFMEESTDVAKIGFGKRSPLGRQRQSAESGELQEALPGDAEGNLQPSQQYTAGRFIDYRSGTARSITGPAPDTLQGDEIVSARRNAGIRVQSLRWNGASITVDQYCPSGYIFGLNTSYIMFYISTLPKYQFGQIEAHLAGDCQMNGGKLGEGCDANPEPSKAKAWACVETRRHPLPMGDEGIVRASKNDELLDEPFTGFKEALETGSPIDAEAEEEPLAA
jgi:hypothetical protein